MYCMDLRAIVSHLPVFLKQHIPGDKCNQQGVYLVEHTLAGRLGSIPSWFNYSLTSLMLDVNGLVSARKKLTHGAATDSPSMQHLL